MKTKVSFMCWWGRSSSWLLQYYSMYSKDGSPTWDNIQGTDNIRDADVILILESLPQDITSEEIEVLKTKKLYVVKHEPPDILRMSQTPSGLSSLPNSLQHLTTEIDYLTQDIWYPSKWDMVHAVNYEELKNLKFKPKEKKLSCIVSGKVMIEGHLSRLNFIDNYLSHGRHDVEIYGRNNLNCKTSHGYIPDDKKDQAYRDYQYTLAFENCRERNYVTCKVFEPLLMWSMPVYWGCPNAHDYLPKECMHYLEDLSYDRINEIDNLLMEPPTKIQVRGYGSCKKFNFR